MQLAQQLNSKNKFSYNNKNLRIPLSKEAYLWSKETKAIMDAMTLPKTIQMYVVYGSKLETPFHVTYQVNHYPWSAGDLLCTDKGCPQNRCIETTKYCEPKMHYVDGDGTVPKISAQFPFKNEKAKNIVRFEVNGASHQSLVRDKKVFIQIEKWLNPSD